MRNRSYWKTIFSAFLVTLVLSIGVTGALCVEPPGEIKYSGKGINAILTVTIVHMEGYAVVTEVCVTSCGGVSFTYGPYVNSSVSDPQALLNITEDLLLDRRIGTAPPGCFSDAGGEDVHISRVNEFHNGTSYEIDPVTDIPIFKGAIGAEVTLHAVLY